MNHAVVVKNLGKKYLFQNNNKPRTFMESVLSGFKDFQKAETFWALQNINFRVNFGEMLGIMGQNGSGKSTLLQLIGNVGKPDHGSIEVNGKLRALLDLGAGFTPDLTGRENVLVGGIVAGLTRKEVLERFNSIVDFAELKEFIDNPVRTYSSGMKMRLAFSVAIHTDPEILLIDEHISVGDTKFKEKCEEKISQIKNDGCAIIYVSQSPKQIQQICDRALWLNKGIPMSYGDAQDVAMEYLAYIHNQKIQENRKVGPHKQQISIIDLKLSPSSEIETGSPLIIEIKYLVKEVIDNFIFRITIVNDEGQICIATAKARDKWTEFLVKREEMVRVNIERLDLTRGEYFVNLSIVQPETNYIYDHQKNRYSLTINSDIKTKAIIQVPCSWELIN